MDMNANKFILFQIAINNIHEGLIANNPSFAQVITWRRIRNNLPPEPIV